MQSVQFWLRQDEFLLAYSISSTTRDMPAEKKVTFMVWRRCGDWDRPLRVSCGTFIRHKLVAQENVQFVELSNVEGIFFSSKVEWHGKINSPKSLSANPKPATLAAVLWNNSRERRFSLKWYKCVSVATSTISQRFECIVHSMTSASALCSRAMLLAVAIIQ